MDPTAALVVSIAASGYLFSTRSYYLKYQLARQSGHRLYLTSFAVGMFFTAITYVFCYIAQPLLYVLENPPYQVVSDLAQVYAFCFLIILIAFLSAQLLNKLGGKTLRVRQVWAAWSRNEFEYTCAIAQAEFKPVAVTLSNRKVFIGYLVGSLSSIPMEGGYIKLLPIYSGARDPATMKLHIRTTYDEIIDKYLDSSLTSDDMNSYSVILPKQSIEILHIYNPSLYQKITGELEVAK